ncbi:MAG: hypothetical protein ACREO8_10975 [Luteimonas sp.]
MRRLYLIAASLALIAMVCAYLLGRAQPDAASSLPPRVAHRSAGDLAAEKPTPAQRSARSAPLPVHGTRLESVFSDLQARADAGDLAAATRLYRDLSLCGRFRAMDWSNTLLADALLSGPVDAMAPVQLENYKAQLDAIESRKQNMQRLHVLCDGTDAGMLDSLVPNLQKAALLGEAHARACYVAVGPNYDARALLRHPQWLDGYRRSVSSLIDAGMAAGDWKIVDILRSAYQPGAEGLLSGVLGSDPDQYYRYLKLSRLGAGPGDSDTLDQQLAAAAAQLPAERLAEADDWAQTTFRRNFNGSHSAESTVAGWDACAFPDQ